MLIKVADAPKFPSFEANYQAMVAEKAQEAEQARLKAAREQAEAEAAKQTAPAPTPVIAAPVRPTVAVAGSCESWMAAAGITDVASARELLRRESGCNPNAINPYSGACGLGQQLPCGKWKHAWNDPVGGLIDMQSYVYERYGSWANALAYHNAHNSY